MAKIPIYNGFEGIAHRFFDVDRINFSYGNITADRQFKPFNEPHIKLIKLHGSVSWSKIGNDVAESFLEKTKTGRCMILPRRTKLTEILEAPYDKLFRYAASVIGKQCKYIVSCGYSYRDEHINEMLFNPKLRENSLRVFALAKDETSEIIKLGQYKSFHYMVSNKMHYNGNDTGGTFNLWDFKEFVKLFN